MRNAFASLLLVSAAAIAQPAVQTASLGECALEKGSAIRDCTVAYRVFGTLDSAKSNAVLFPTWFTGTSKDLAGLIAPNGLVDSSRYFVIAVDAFGNGFSSSPSNSREQARLSFPQFTIRDMVNAQHRLLQEVLHIDHLHAVVGISMGGMQAFQWAVSYPEFADRVVPIVGSPRLTSYDLMLWRTEEEAILADADWRAGAYQSRPPLRALADIHTLALTTPSYRVRETGRGAYPEFIANTEAGGSGQMDPADWLYQLRAMMAQNVAAPFGDSMADAARSAKTRMLVVVAAQDHMVNPQPALDFAKVRGTKTLVLTGDCGHMATACESGLMTAEVRRFLASSK
jgi:homoserine O-acetyltransferase